jgi:hypothetical protein
VSKKDSFKIAVWTSQFIGTKEKANSLIDLVETVDDCRWVPDLWSEVEPIRNKYSQDSRQSIIDSWSLDEPVGSGNAYNFLFFKRRSPMLFLMSHARRWGKPLLNSTWVELEAKPFEGDDGPSRLKMILIRMIEWCNGVYGYVQYSREAHHRVAQGTPLKRLERIYWMNYFGKPYVDLIGEEIFLKAPCYLVENTPCGGVVLQATRRFDAPAITDSAETLVGIESYLGSELFAGIDFSEIPCVVPQFDLTDVTPR